MKREVKILQKLKPTEKHYTKKVMILAQLMNEPNTGHILDEKLVCWSRRMRLKPELHCEDKTTWWTIRSTNKLTK